MTKIRRAKSIETTQAAIALGSNLGDRLAHMRAGVAGLKRLGSVEKISSLYETAPVGGPEQEDYLNAVVILDTGLTPGDLFVGLIRIEVEDGRVRVEPWGPRTLDLDLIVYGTERVEEPDLVVPHPRAHLRRFVLDPLAEIWPDAMLGAFTAKALSATVSRQDVVLLHRHWA
jgi:2-amino-4-hydroxy-6-hydroxymethyldihydropteridine diphosphokinase